MKKKVLVLSVFLTFLLLSACFGKIMGSEAGGVIAKASDDERMFLPLEDTLLQAGYLSFGGDDKKIFRKGTLTLVFDKNEQSVKKNVFTYYLSDVSKYAGGVLYIEKCIIEKMTGQRIIINNEEISFEDLSFPPHEWTKNGVLVAHAGGGITDLNGRNSLEAFVTNYNIGHTVFEIDLLLTSDKQIAAIHDWDGYGNGGMPLTLEKFKDIRIYGVFTPMDIDDVLRLMTLNKEIFIITDTKSYEDSPGIVREHFTILRDKALAYDKELLNRIVPQIYNQEMYYIIKEVYPFNSIIYTLYQSPDTDSEVVKFVKDKDDIQVVAMAPSRFSVGFQKELEKNGKLTYLFTLNDVSEVKEYFSKGVHGVYTDFITPGDL